LSSWFMKILRNLYLLTLFLNQFFLLYKNNKPKFHKINKMKQKYK
jgi:hypothetical protein